MVGYGLPRRPLITYEVENDLEGLKALTKKPKLRDKL